MLQNPLISFLYIYPEKISFILSVFRRIGRIVILFLMPALILLAINSVANRHNHLIRGYVYTHAHPFQDEGSDVPYQSHSHSGSELIILDLLSDFEVLISVLVLGLIVFSQPKIAQHPGNIRFISFFRSLSLPPRAPPRFV